MASQLRRVFIAANLLRISQRGLSVLRFAASNEAPWATEQTIDGTRSPPKADASVGMHDASGNQWLFAGDPSPGLAAAAGAGQAATRYGVPAHPPAHPCPTRLEPKTSAGWLLRAGGTDHWQPTGNGAGHPQAKFRPHPHPHPAQISPPPRPPPLLFTLRNNHTAQIERPRPLLASISHCRAIRTIAKGAPFCAAAAAALAAAAGSAVAPRPKRYCVAAGRALPAGDVARRLAGGS
ncbi:hypothetical protein TOPH_02100 [Tolypocladium ophioglossoides CBS 100239]|uniref:Uncharacterized protein n=1 Tax=Tolypocladium ophioglossoides (strain CBS 100239) TaxID=1163406 RepID=A0A0L0NH26_TOLOC|nr:hypothetical protein TOPH_02100 [Tolypocladium ophioglossoides CBS 100239]